MRGEKKHGEWALPWVRAPATIVSFLRLQVNTRDAGSLLVSRLHGAENAIRTSLKSDASEWTSGSHEPCTIHQRQSTHQEVGFVGPVARQNMDRFQGTTSHPRQWLRIIPRDEDHVVESRNKTKSGRPDPGGSERPAWEPLPGQWQNGSLYAATSAGPCAWSARSRLPASDRSTHRLRRAPPGKSGHPSRRHASLQASSRSRARGPDGQPHRRWPV